MKTFSLVCLALFLSSSLQAQEPPPAASAPPSGSGKIPFSALTPEEREILYNGEIGDGEYYGGAFTGTFLGFGIGHAIQGRYGNKGWIFTLGEVGSIGLLGLSVVECSLSTIGGGSCTGGPATAATLGALGYAFFRVWEIVDLWVTPPSINREYRILNDTVERPPRVSLGVIPLASNGLELGLRYRF